jgi:hypothetical protein
MDAHLATHLGDPPALEGQVPQSFRPGAVDATELKHLCSICEAASIRVGPVSGARLHFARPWLGVRKALALALARRRGGYESAGGVHS